MSNETPSDPPFGSIHIIDPPSNHTHTIIFLHGRGSNGRGFAEEFLASRPPNDLLITQKLPGLRWVFPSSPTSWSDVFQESRPSWFDAHSLTDITARRDLQIPGIRRSVAYIQTLLEDEISRLDGDSGRVFLGGISQGGAIGMWTLLFSRRRLAGFVAVNTWLPFAGNMEKVMRGGDKFGEIDTEEEEFDAFVKGEIDFEDSAARQTPVLMGHGTDDAWVDVTLGRQARDFLEQVGAPVTRREYVGAEDEGHWFKVPEQVEDIYHFLQGIVSRETKRE